jgi:hypothetical protein
MQMSREIIKKSLSKRKKLVAFLVGPCYLLTMKKKAIKQNPLKAQLIRFANNLEQHAKISDKVNKDISILLNISKK